MPEAFGFGKAVELDCYTAGAQWGRSVVSS